MKEEITLWKAASTAKRDITAALSNPIFRTIGNEADEVVRAFILGVVKPGEESEAEVKAMAGVKAPETIAYYAGMGCGESLKMLFLVFLQSLTGQALAKIKK